MSEEKKALTRKQKRIAIAVGAVLALVCHALPPEYQGPCITVLKICTGGL